MTSHRLIIAAALAGGVAVGAGVVLMLKPHDAQAQVGPPAPQSQYGRYVIVHSPHVRADTLMIDSLTGRTWRQIVYTDLNGDPPVWRPIDQVDSNAQMQDLVTKYGLKAQQPARK